MKKIDDDYGHTRTHNFWARTVINDMTSLMHDIGEGIEDQDMNGLMIGDIIFRTSLKSTVYRDRSRIPKWWKEVKMMIPIGDDVSLIRAVDLLNDIQDCLRKSEGGRRVELSQRVIRHNG
jgi:hypothetical protein